MPIYLSGLPHLISPSSTFCLVPCALKHSFLCPAGEHISSFLAHRVLGTSPLDFRVPVYVRGFQMAGEQYEGRCPAETTRSLSGPRRTAPPTGKGGDTQPALPFPSSPFHSCTCDPFSHPLHLSFLLRTPSPPPLHSFRSTLSVPHASATPSLNHTLLLSQPILPAVPLPTCPALRAILVLPLASVLCSTPSPSPNPHPQHLRSLPAHSHPRPSVPNRCLLFPTCP